MLRGSASKKTVVASERDRPDIARRRAQWMSRQGQIDPERLVFIDETWTKTNMAPLRGWAPHGQRLVAKVPHGHWKTTAFLAALRHDRIEAPWLIDGPIDGEGFRAYVETALWSPRSSRAIW
jgi:putative transposase